MYKGQNPGHAGWYQPLGDLQTQHFRGFRTVDPPSIRKLSRGFAPRTPEMAFSAFTRRVRRGAVIRVGLMS
jgi:hypothetical protein